MIGNCKTIKERVSKYPVGFRIHRGRYGFERLEHRLVRNEEPKVVEIWSKGANTKSGRTFEIIPYYSDGDMGQICPEKDTLRKSINELIKRDKENNFM